ncbi:NADPH:quinone oxidoreductase family protein [Shewanella sp. VB17]|uniref:NADPH:quinone oxidoreductase family protein n=1 Tax=Shewanella sp. VB17 TaxID=2739432 RepID=UPI001567BBEA|nr:NADPH:quinone oxidoreductase family protein [Shewanella sp. VB17]NRD72195.1 NADPH:quinone oxidoreductase family protein [Shewanella sp. VB17]
MKALLSTIPGGPDTLELRDIPSPAPAPHEVRVKVRSCAVNYPDVLIIKDHYQDKPQRPFIPGSEMAGIVDAVGSQVKSLKVGDQVFGATGNKGGMAEQVNIPENDCYIIPPGLPFEEASALLLTYGTTYYALKNLAQLNRGETLLVLGAGGGVGLAAVELGKVMGAQVVAVASSQEKLDLALRHGASAGVICSRDPLDKNAAKHFKHQLKTVCGNTGPNVIFDPVGGDYTEPALRSIAHNGRYLVIGFTAGIPKIPFNLVLLKACQVMGVLWGAFASQEAQANRNNVHELIALCQQGKIKPFISERFPLAKADEAISRLEKRLAMGKVVVTMESAIPEVAIMTIEE